MLESEVNYKRR